MRTLHADLTTAQKSPSREPYVHLDISNEGTDQTILTNKDATNLIASVHHWEEGYSGGATIRMLNGSKLFIGENWEGYRVKIGWGYNTLTGYRYSEPAPVYIVSKRDISIAGQEAVEFNCVDLFAKAEKTQMVLSGLKLPATVTLSGTPVRLQTITNTTRTGSAKLIDTGADFILVSNQSGSFLSGDIVTGTGISITLTGDAIAQTVVGGGAYNRDVSILDILHLALVTPGILSNIVVDSDDPGTITSTYMPYLPISSGTSARYLLRQIMQMFRCGFRIDSNKVGHIMYLDPAAVADYTYTMADHIIWQSVYERGVIMPNHCIMVDTTPDGLGHTYTYIGDASDATSVARLGTISTVESNPTVDSNAIATALATSWIAKRVAEASQGFISVPMNCGQELYDMVSATGKNSQEVKARVGRIDRWYEANSQGQAGGRYEMQIQLGGLSQQLGEINIPGATGDDIKDLADGVGGTMPKLDSISWITILPRAIQGFESDVGFTASDQSTIVMTPGTIKFYDGTTQAINYIGSGTNTTYVLPTSAIYYIYFDLADATPARLKVTTDYESVMTMYTGLICEVQKGSTANIKATVIPSKGKMPLITPDIIHMTGLVDYDFGSGKKIPVIYSTDISAGHILLSSVVDGGGYQKYTATEASKLLGIEAGAQVFSGRSISLLTDRTLGFIGDYAVGDRYASSAHQLTGAGLAYDTFYSKLTAYGLSFWSANSTTRTEFTANGLKGYNSNVLQIEVSASDGKLYAGAGAVVLDASGITITGQAMRLVAGAYTGYLYLTIGGELWHMSGSGTHYFNGNLLPTGAPYFNLGSVSYYWVDGYISTVHANAIIMGTGNIYPVTDNTRQVGVNGASFAEMNAGKYTALISGFYCKSNGDASSYSGYACIYSKDVGGVAKLFARDGGGSAPVQLTP